MHVNDKNHLLIPSEYDDTWLYIVYIYTSNIHKASNYYMYYLYLYIYLM